jgi:hypothetical protein
MIDEVSNIHSPPLQRPQKPLVAGALARVYIRRNADPASIQRLKERLAEDGTGEWGFGQRGAWMTIDVAAPEDLRLIRTEFYRLIDGWQELS